MTLKPIEKIIIEAACQYWEVEPGYFEQKKCGHVTTYRKSIIYYLIRENTGLSFKAIAELLGFVSHQPVKRLIENLDATKEVLRNQKQDILNVQSLVATLVKEFPKEAPFLKPKKVKPATKKTVHPLAKFQTTIL